MSIPVDLEPLPNSYTWGKVVARLIHGVEIGRAHV